MKTEFIDTLEDMKWLRDVHLPQLDLAKYKSAIIVGNEDSPARIEVYESKDPNPLGGDKAVIYESDAHGVYRQKKRVTYFQGRPVRNPYASASSQWPRYEYRLRRNRGRFDIELLEHLPGQDLRMMLLSVAHTYESASNRALDLASSRRMDPRNPNPVIVWDDNGQCLWVFLAGSLIADPADCIEHKGVAGAVQHNPLSKHAAWTVGIVGVGALLIGGVAFAMSRKSKSKSVPTTQNECVAVGYVWRNGVCRVDCTKFYSPQGALLHIICL